MRYYSKRYKARLSVDYRNLLNVESSAFKEMKSDGTTKRVWGRFRCLTGGWAHRFNKD